MSISYDIYDHGCLYILSGKTHYFNLHPTAILTDETKSRHSLEYGCVNRLQVSLEPKYPGAKGLFGWDTENVIQKQVLKVCAYQAQVQNEFSIIEWFYSKRPLKEKEFPKLINRIQIIVLDDTDEANLERNLILHDCEPDEFSPPLGDNANANHEYRFFHYAFSLINEEGAGGVADQHVVREFERVVRMSRNGRISWDQLSGFPEGISYLEATNFLIRKITKLFITKKISAEDLKKLTAFAEQIYDIPFAEFVRFRTACPECEPPGNSRKHKVVLGFWKSQSANLLKLTEINQSATNLESDDLAVQVKETDFINVQTSREMIEDFLVKLIIPTFFIIVLSYFWYSR